MDAPSLASDVELLDRMPTLVLQERACSAEVIAHLAEIDRRRLFLEVATSSLSSYCMERLGYGEDEAAMRVRVTRLSRSVPQVLEELRAGRIHLSGLAVLAQYLTSDDSDELLAAARNKSRRQIEALIANRFPRPSLPDAMQRQSEQPSVLGPASGTDGGQSIRSGAGTNLASKQPDRLQPLSTSCWSVQFTASAELQQKIEQARELLSHSLPTGDLAGLFERALDALIERETKRRFGAGKARKRRLLSPGSRHVPVDVARQVWQRDGGRYTLVREAPTSRQRRRLEPRRPTLARPDHDRQMRPITNKPARPAHADRQVRESRSARAKRRSTNIIRFVTFEHLQPFALGGSPTLDNLCLRCSAHNALAARKVFGNAHIDAKCAERRREANPGIANESSGRRASVHAKVHAALRAMGFPEAAVRRALSELERQELAPELDSLLRAALGLLVPAAPMKLAGATPI